MNDAAKELVGRTVAGRFRLTAFLGEGAMASVYRAEQDDEPRDVAVKIMHPVLLRDATFAKRFAREAKAAARIVHPNSVRILEHGSDGEQLYYLAMELLVGQDLFDILARERRLPEARAVRILLQVCAALGAAHAHGIVHRDLKPENIMILPDPEVAGADRVKVLDFGIAKILERGTREEDAAPQSGPVSSAPPSSMLTMVGGVVGTPEYMSPEQARGAPVDGRSDLYACGALLYHLVTGRPPFKSDHVIEVLMAHADKPPPPPSTLWPDIHPDLERVILKALSKSPDDRQQTAAELAAELSAVEASTSGRVVRRAAQESVAPALPGVPVRVAISTPAEGISRVVSASEPPPATLRSPPPSTAAVPGTPLELPPDDALAYEKTLSVAPDNPARAAAAPAFDKTLVVESAPAPAPAPAFDKTLVVESPPAARPASVAPPAGPINSAAAFATTLPADLGPLDLPPARGKHTLVDPSKHPSIDVAVAASDPPPPPKPSAPPPPVAMGDPKRVPQTPPAREALAHPQDRLIAPWWVFAVAVVVLSAAIWLMRYLRLGAAG